MSTTNTKTMTAREYVQTVLDAHLSDEMDALSEKYIKGLDARNEKRKSADSKEKQAVRERLTAVLKFLHENKDQQFTRDAIAEAVGIKVGEAQSAALALAREGLVNKSEVKIDKARRVVYSAAE